MSQAGVIDIPGNNPQIPTQFDTDSGFAIPLANVLEILGNTVANATYPKPLETTASGNTVLANIQVGKAIAGAPPDKNDAGLVSFDNTVFSVDANGYVTFVGGGPGVDSIGVDVNTVPGTDPVLPDGSGTITVTGAQVAAGTTANVIRTNSTVANAYTIEIQRSSEQLGSTASANGVCHFDSNEFNVDPNGFVTLQGGTIAIDSIAVQTGTSPVVPDVNGLLTINGAVVAAGTNPVRSDGTGANTLAIEVQISQAIVASDATKIGLSNFDSAAFDVDANGFVQLNGGGVATSSFDVQANTAPGTDPVVPSAAGVVTVNGAVVANHSVVLETRSRAANAYNLEVQYATSAAATDGTKSGVAHFNSAQFSVDANGFVQATSALTTDLHWPKFIVGDLANGANYTTLASAYAAASSGDVIAIQANTVLTENLTVDKTIYLVGLGTSGHRDYQAASSRINGKFTVNTRLIASGLTFQTNGDVSFLMNAASSLVILQDCYLNGTNANSFTGHTATSNVICKNCSGFWASTYTFGAMDITTTQWFECNFGCVGTLGVTTTNTSFYIRGSALTVPLQMNTGGGVNIVDTQFGIIFTPFVNQTWLTTTGTQGANLLNCIFYSGTASAINVGVGTIVTAVECVVNSSNTNAITGAGSLIYSALSFTGTSVKINTTTQTGGTLQGGVTQAPSEGFLGQQIRATVSSGAPVTSATTVYANMTSMSLTAGVWDVNLIIVFTGMTTGIACRYSISTTSATIGTLGDATGSFPLTSTTNQDASFSVPQYRLTLTSTTTVYAVFNSTYSVGTVGTYGRMSATRVG